MEKTTTPTAATDHRRTPAPFPRPTGEGLHPLTLGALRGLKLPKRENLLPWLRQGESAMVFAPTGLGKSLFALSLALAVAGGGRFIDWWNAPKARRVLFVDGEMPLDDIQARVDTLQPCAGGNCEAIAANLHIMNRQYQPGGVAYVDLAEEASREALVRHVKKHEIDLVILDNLSTLATIDGENSASAFNDTVAFLLRLKQEGIACLLVHHSGKSGESYRGSSKIATTFEVIIKLEKLGSPEDYASTGQDLKVKLGAACLFGTEDGAQASKGGQWACEPWEDQQVEIMLALLRSGNYATQKELAAAMPGGGVSETYFSRRLKARAFALGLTSQGQWVECLRRGGEAKKAAMEVGNDKNFVAVAGDDF